MLKVDALARMADSLRVYDVDQMAGRVIQKDMALGHPKQT